MDAIRHWARTRLRQFLRMFTTGRDLPDFALHKYAKPITQEEVDDYEAITYFTGVEVYEAFDLYAFHTRNEEYVPQTGLYMDKNELFRRMPSFWVCPFKARLMKLFSFDQKVMTFADWMGLHSSYHCGTPLEHKMEVAFRLYDFDEDGFISHVDLIEYLVRSNGDCNELALSDYDEIAKMVMEYYDIDNDGYISLTDFKLRMQNDVDFEHNFIQETNLRRDLRQFTDFHEYEGYSWC